MQIVCLIVIDLAAFYCCLFIAWIWRAEITTMVSPDLPFFFFSYVHFVSFWWIPVVFIFFIAYETLYTSNHPFWDEAWHLVKSVTLASIMVFAIVSLGKMSARVSRLVLVGMWFSSLFVFPVFRLWGKKFLHKVGIWKERVLVLGAGNAGRLVIEGLLREKHMGFDILGFLDDDDRKKGTYISGKKVFGSIKHFPKFVKELGIRTIIIAMPSLPPERLSTLTADIQNNIPNTMIIPDLRGIALLNTDLFHLFSEEIFLMNIRNNLKSLTNRFLKAFFDITVSVISIPFLLLVIVIIGVLIRLETPGPVIYSHERIGRKGRTFKCYKFRTMHRDAEERLREILERDDTVRTEWESTWKLRDDPRITRIGRFLRKTSLDELPQIFNVLKREMSLVGPRPVTKDEIDAHYKGTFTIFINTLPGITGLWQVSGRTNTSYEYRVRLDWWYIMNWSLWLDIAIIFKTVKAVVKMEGAY